MIAAVLCALAAVAMPQDTGMFSVPVYRNQVYGVALPRPFDDWVFSAGRSPRTTTVLFHPRLSSLREQLWGALVLTSFDGPVPLGAVADQRVQGTWQPELGPSFRLLARDSVTVAGLSAIHLVMAGAVNRVAVDVEEYAIARGRDLVVLQFRYPRGLPRDSIAAGYERVLLGLAIRADAAAVPVVDSRGRDGAAREARVAQALAGSPWRPRAIEARVWGDSGPGPMSVVARVEAVNEDVRARDTLVVALRAPLTIDSIRGATGRAFAGASGPLVTLRLPQPVEALAATAVTVFYSLPDVGRAVHAPGARTSGGGHTVDWLPVIEPSTDSAGVALPKRAVRRSVRFDLPTGLTGVTAGRLVVDFTANGRRQMAWVTDDESADASGFVVGPLRRVLLRPGPLVSVRVWLDPSLGATVPEGRAGEIADTVLEAWTFYTRAFGRVAYQDAEVVLGEVAQEPVAGATLFLSPFVTLSAVRESVARVWWGQTVRFAGRGAEWLSRALPRWSALALTAVLDGDSVRQRLVRESEVEGEAVASLEAVRRAVGDPRFRAALREFFLNHRHRSASLADLRAAIGAEGSQALPSPPSPR